MFIKNQFFINVDLKKIGENVHEKTNPVGTLRKKILKNTRFINGRKNVI